MSTDGTNWTLLLLQTEVLNACYDLQAAVHGADADTDAALSTRLCAASAMTMSGLILGLLDIAIVVALLLFIGAIIEWFLNWIAQIAIPPNVRKGFLVLVALIALYMLVSLLLGVPSIRLLRL